jgi:hypothetical protein
MLRPLLRSEVGEVSNRRAWHEPAKLTAEVLEHYKRPLRARNWDAALVEVPQTPVPIAQQPSRSLAAPSMSVTTQYDDWVSWSADCCPLLQLPLHPLDCSIGLMLDCDSAGAGQPAAAGGDGAAAGGAVRGRRPPARRRRHGRARPRVPHDLRRAAGEIQPDATPDAAPPPAGCLT